MSKRFARAAVLIVMGACSSSLPSPARTTHPEAAFVEVPYPPPAALAEVVPPPPEDVSAVWVDGYWVWRGRYYVWQRGGWLVPPPQAAYAEWLAYVAPDGRLLFAPGAWYDAAGRELPAPDLVRVARTPPNQTTPETDTLR